MTARDEARLIGVHPDVVTRLRRVFAAFPGAQGPSSSRLFVVEGLRTAARQAELWAIGRTRDGAGWRVTGRTVTQCDGVRVRSKHQAAADGLGRAVDVAWAPTADNKDPYRGPWLEFGRAVERAGLRWGGLFPRVDMPHVEGG